MKQKIGTYKNIHTGELGNNRSNKQVLSELFNIKPIKTDAQDLLDSCDTKIKGEFFK